MSESSAHSKYKYFYETYVLGVCNGSQYKVYLSGYENYHNEKYTSYCVFQKGHSGQYTSCEY